MVFHFPLIPYIVLTDRSESISSTMRKIVQSSTKLSTAHSDNTGENLFNIQMIAKNPKYFGGPFTKWRKLPLLDLQNHFSIAILQ